MIVPCGRCWRSVGAGGARNESITRFRSVLALRETCVLRGRVDGEAVLFIWSRRPPDRYREMGPKKRRAQCKKVAAASQRASGSRVSGVRAVVATAQPRARAPELTVPKRANVYFMTTSGTAAARRARAGARAVAHDAPVAQARPRAWAAARRATRRTCTRRTHHVIATAAATAARTRNTSSSASDDAR